MGNITINITSAGAVDREFFDIASPPLPPFGIPLGQLLASCAPLGCPWAPLEPTLAFSGSFGVPFGCLWASFGAPLGQLWASFAPLGCPWAPFGVPRLPLGASGQLGRLRGPHRKPMALKYRAWRQNQDPRNLPADPPDPPDPADPGEVVARSAVRSPTSTRAGGQDDVSFTNSLKLAFDVYYQGWSVPCWL